MWKSIEECFGTIDDPRMQGRCYYTLVEIITIAICAIISGSETWTDIETYGKSKETWLKNFYHWKTGFRRTIHWARFLPYWMQNNFRQALFVGFNLCFQ